MNKPLTILYIFKHRCIYVGWIVSYTPIIPPLYCDNVKTLEMRNEYDLSYMTIGFTENGVKRKLLKYMERHPSKYEFRYGKLEE